MQKKHAPQPDATESQIQAACTAWLRLVGLVPIKITNEGKRGAGAARRFAREGLLAGAADLVVMAPGGAVMWIEFKSRTGRMSKEQEAFRETCAAMGHRYFVARSLEDVQLAVADGFGFVGEGNGR